MSDRNENRPGYKKTKVGWIPKEWEIRRLEQLCLFSSGHGFRKQDWSSEGLPIIRIQNLNDSNDFNYFAGETDPKWLVFPGDLLFAWAGVKGVSFGPTILGAHSPDERASITSTQKFWKFLLEILKNVPHRA